VTTSLPLIRIADIPDPERPRRRPRWGRWRLRRRPLVLEHDRGYQIPLERCGNPIAVLDWLVHLSQKTWCTTEDLGDLVLALNTLLQLSGPEYCGQKYGEKTPVNVRQHLRQLGWLGRRK